MAAPGPPAGGVGVGRLQLTKMDDAALPELTVTVTPAAFAESGVIVLVATPAVVAPVGPALDGEAQRHLSRGERHRLLDGRIFRSLADLDGQDAGRCYWADIAIE